MKIKRALLALAASAAAALMFALPASAFAADKTLTQDDFKDANNSIYTIEEAGTYTLGENVTGTIKVKLTAGYGNVVIDLNDKTLSNAADSATKTDLIDVRNSDVTVKNGTLVSYNNSVVRTNDSWACNVTLDDVDATSSNHHCIDIVEGEATIKSGTYTVSLTDSKSTACNVLIAESSAKIKVQGGTFKGGRGNIVEEAGVFSSITLAGGSFESLPTDGRLEDGKAAVCVKGNYGSIASYDVKTLDDARNGNKGAVLDAGGLEIVFYPTYDEATAALSGLGSLAKAYEVKDCTVTFNVNGGTSLGSVTVSFYDTVAMPDTIPAAKDNQAFASWQLNGNDYNFSNHVIENITLNATFGDPIAEVISNGITTTYANLQLAVDRATKGSTIKLVASFSGDSVKFKNKANIVFELNGQTFTGMISAMNCGGLKITNGTIKGRPVAAWLYHCVDVQLNNVDASMSEDVKASANNVLVCAESSDVEITGGTYDGGLGTALTIEPDYDDESGDSYYVTINSATFKSTESYAVGIDDCSQVIVNGGTFTSVDHAALGVYDCGTVTINDGTFTCTDSVAIYAVADYYEDDEDEGEGEDEEVAEMKLSINGGTFTGRYDKAPRSDEDNNDDTQDTHVPEWANGCVFAGPGCDLAVSGGSFNDFIASTMGEHAGGTVSLTGGTFGSGDNAGSVASGYAMLKKSGSDGKYVVLSRSAARSQANWLVTVTDSAQSTTNLYFVSESDARSYYDAQTTAGNTATITAIEHYVDPYTSADSAAAKQVTDQLSQVQTDYAQVDSSNAQAAADAAQAALDAYNALTSLQKTLVSTTNVSAVQVVLDQAKARPVADMIDNVLAKYVPVTTADAQAAADAAQAALDAYEALTDAQKALISSDNVSAVQAVPDQAKARPVADMISDVFAKLPITAANAQEELDAINAAITAYGNLTQAQRELVNKYAGDGQFDMMVDVRDAAQAQVTANGADEEALTKVKDKVAKKIKLSKKAKKAGKKTLKAISVTVKAAKSASGAKATWSKVSASKGLKVKGNKVTLKKGAKRGKYIAKLCVTYGGYFKTVKVVIRVK